MSSHPVETILATGLKRLLQWAVPLTVLMLIFGSPETEGALYWYALGHLVVVQVATYLFTIEIGSLTDNPWFGRLKRPWLASCATVVASAVGFSALLTLATSAAARFDVSLQFLQLLSSLDIAWVVAALYLGSRLLWGNAVGLTLGVLLLLACVVSIAIYLAVVGFTDTGGWRVDGPALLGIVISSDVMAAIISLTTLLVASRRAGQPTRQPSAQS